MDAAASTAPDVHTENGVEHSNASRTLRPLIKAIEMVFGSAAALSATFGYKVTSVLLLLSGRPLQTWSVQSYSGVHVNIRRQDGMHRMHGVQQCIIAKHTIAMHDLQDKVGNRCEAAG